MGSSKSNVAEGGGVGWVGQFEEEEGRVIRERASKANWSNVRSTCLFKGYDDEKKKKYNAFNQTPPPPPPSGPIFCFTYSELFL